MDSILDLAIELKQHESARNARRRRADRPGDGCLRIAFVDQALVAARFLNRTKVLVLDVVGQDELQLLRAREVPHNNWHHKHAGLARGCEPAVSRDNGSISRDQQWLEDASL